MIARLENYTPNDLMERFIKFAVIKVLYAKIKFGMGLDDKTKTFNDQIYNLTRGLISPTVNKLHH